MNYLSYVTETTHAWCSHRYISTLWSRGMRDLYFLSYFKVCAFCANWAALTLCALCTDSVVIRVVWPRWSCVLELLSQTEGCRLSVQIWSSPFDPGSNGLVRSSESLLQESYSLPRWLLTSPITLTSIAGRTLTFIFLVFSQTMSSLEVTSFALVTAAPVRKMVCWVSYSISASAKKMYICHRLSVYPTV